MSYFLSGAGSERTTRINPGNRLQTLKVKKKKNQTWIKCDSQGKPYNTPAIVSLERKTSFRRKLLSSVWIIVTLTKAISLCEIFGGTFRTNSDRVWWRARGFAGSFGGSGSSFSVSLDSSPVALTSPLSDVSLWEKEKTNFTTQLQAFCNFVTRLGYPCWNNMKFPAVLLAIPMIVFCKKKYEQNYLHFFFTFRLFSLHLIATFLLKSQKKDKITFT